MPVFRNEVPRASSPACATHAPALVPVGSVGCTVRGTSLSFAERPRHSNWPIRTLADIQSDSFHHHQYQWDSVQCFNDLINYFIFDSSISIGGPGCLRFGSLKPSQPASCIASVPGGEITTRQHAMPAMPMPCLCHAHAPGYRSGLQSYHWKGPKHRNTETEWWKWRDIETSRH